MKTAFETPILFLIFNRPDTTQLVFNEIRKQKPKYLFVAADGPRSHKPGEAEKCEDTRAIIQQIDWDCEVKTLFREENLGCGRAVSSSITWFFDNVEEGIILEDDCLPNDSFFKFTSDLLRKYKDDERVFAISGDNFIGQLMPNNESYYFSIYNHVWGWASWKRAWKHYDLGMKSWPSIKKSGHLKTIFENKKQFSYWVNIFDACYAGKIDTWDYQWTFACWSRNGLTILPALNLIRNIGFDERATHTKDENGFSLETLELDFPLRNPNEIKQNLIFDELTWQKNFKPKKLSKRIIDKLASLRALLK
ncbi:MAG: hypothetical protein Q7U04_17505 [Bacteriovorax sp.]|nr:hypothetical protein [Bacteriovorax sp.]